MSLNNDLSELVSLGRAVADSRVSAVAGELRTMTRRAQLAEQRFLHCIYAAALGWVLAVVLGVFCAAHASLHHSSSSTLGAASTTAAPSFSEVTK